MMKKIKTLVTVIAAAAAMILPAGVCGLRASAAEPATFHFWYDQEDHEWYVVKWKPSPEADEDVSRHVLQFFYNEVKDGDVVVVSNEDSDAPQLELGSVKLSNVTLLGDSAFTMIQAGSIQDFFALDGSECAITAPITNAYIYDNTLTQLNNNVQNILVTPREVKNTSTIGCAGTVGSLKVAFPNNTSYTLYNFREGTMLIRDGELMTSDEDYSSDPPASSTPAPSATSKPSSSGNSADEYDHVPKTGETNVVVWLLCAGALCMALSCVLRKTSKSHTSL